MIKNTFCNFDIGKDITSIATNNAPDTFKSMKIILRVLKNVKSGQYCDPEIFLLGSISYVIHLGVKEAVRDVHIKIMKIRTLLSTMKSSKKPHDLFETVCREISVSYELQYLDSEKRRSSTLTMIKRAFVRKRVSKVVTSLVQDLNEYDAMKVHPRSAEKFCKFFGEYWRHY